MSLLPPSAPVPSDLALLDAAQLRRAYERLPMSLGLSALALALFLAPVSRFFAPVEVVVWAVLMALAVLVRGGSWLAYRQLGWPQDAPAPALWRHAFTLGTVLSALCWSFGPALLLSRPDDAAAQGAAVMVGTLLFVCAAALPAMVAQPLALQCFLAATLLPPALGAWLAGRDASRLLALVLLFGLGVLLLSARRFGRAMLALYQAQAGLRQSAELAQAMRAQAETASLAKTRFLANMSHELRTPLNAVIGAAQLLRVESADADQHDDRAGPTGPTGNERQAQLVEAIQQGGRNLLGLIENILDLSRIESGALTLHESDFHLVECVEAALSTAALAAQAKGLALACVVDPALPAWRHGDAPRLRQVLLNLLGNAVKFTARGEVVLHVQPGATPAAVRVSVSDTGVGIAPAALAHVFEPFRQGDEGADRRFGGSGLGLAIVRQLVQAMGGQIGVTSQPGQGTCFTLELPLPPARQPAPEAAPLRHRVAYVEPHEASARALAALLQRLGCDAQRCHNGADLHAWLATAPHDAPAPWLLLAAETPDADELLAAAVECVAPQQVIAMTTELCLESSRARARLHLAREIIKPVTRAALVSRLVADPRQSVTPAAGRTPPALLSQAEFERLTHVLVVEDDALNRAIVSGLLQHAGCRVSEAADGPQALALLRDAPRVDLVLMDWQMPGMDGLETTRRLRAGAAGAAGAAVPIVALTANAFAEDRAACLAAGMNDFLTKPVLAASLLAMVTRWAAPPPAGAAAGTAHAAGTANTAGTVHPAGTVPAQDAAAGTPAPPDLPALDRPALDRPVVFDPTVLAALPMVADGTAPEYAGELLAMFETTATEALRDIAQALGQADLARLQRLVHTLKSTSASVGACELAALAAEAEASLRGGHAPAADLHAGLERAWRRLQALLARRMPAAAGATP